MKKIILILAIVSLKPIFAQIEKKTIFIGGVRTLQATNYGLANSKRNSLSINYMLGNRISLGAEYALGFHSLSYFRSQRFDFFSNIYLLNKENFALYSIIGTGISSYHPYVGMNNFGFFKTGIGASVFLNKNLSLNFENNFVIDKNFPYSFHESKIGLNFYLNKK